MHLYSSDSEVQLSIVLKQHSQSVVDIGRTRARTRSSVVEGNNLHNASLHKTNSVQVRICTASV